ncbi:hypothetical protein [Lentilactobacillus parakefiri]|uniref:Uncharacterized protein n=1 Tax=Lentilactobacillus parakefiri TaxID=152332 RepID=A0A269YPC7_9LACO|nr:hypothetical protein [Lentilactobacillus parakefiri]KRL54415.1 hypothetical protein FD08_GL004332 [Lentilactobacillus parakefiri DSM 10551]PAK87403.1 hypothetical protein B8W98_01045 [Lentilactobacillus parakefiri]PAL00463.1 hypothetical protein B8W96_06540 [Lentilactobacillus parakefiri]TDG90363.1 hypothetical protein C5L28_001567 [Lentilactobacillus parakefiri]GAW71964.1 hypothetical protein LPKJCM_01069 [Lentilactobacillus parakefiri]
MDIILAVIWILLATAVFTIVVGAFYLIYKNARGEPAPYKWRHLFVALAVLSLLFTLFGGFISIISHLQYGTP